MSTAESTGATRSTFSSRARNFALEPTKFNVAIVVSPLPESGGVLTPAKSCSLLRTSHRSLKDCNLPLRRFSFTFDPLTDVCWAILQCYAVHFTTIEKGDCISTYKRYVL